MTAKAQPYLDDLKADAPAEAAAEAAPGESPAPSEDWADRFFM